MKFCGISSVSISIVETSPSSASISSSGCSAISAAPKSSTSSAVSSSSSIYSFRLVQLLRLVLYGSSSAEIFFAQVLIVPSAGTALGNNIAILIMVAIGRSLLLS
jgi:hypothetical protein